MKKIMIIGLLFVAGFAQAQDSGESLKIYLDCQDCDLDYYKQELSYVEFVRDRKYADVHIFFTTQWNATGGKKYTIEFSGAHQYKDIHDVLEFSTTGETTKEQKRKLIMKNLELGLIRFWIANGLKDKISLSLKKDKKDKKVEEDPWNKWTFRFSARGYFNGQETSSSRYFNGNISVKQVKDKNKFTLYLSENNSKSVFKYNDEEIISERKSTYLYGDDIYSISNHVSVGLFAGAGNSLYSNQSLFLYLKPGVEYNFFPYTMSEKKAIFLNFKVGPNYNKYYDLTAFGKTEELLWQQNITLGGLVVKKWGNISSNVEYRSYLHDLSLNGFNFNIETNLHLFKGFSLDLYASYGLSHDQVNIRALGASREDLLLRQQQIKSGYNYYTSAGISYTFGSIYNTIVNPRFSL